MDVLLPARCAACAAEPADWTSPLCAACSSALDPAPSPVHMPAGDPVAVLHSPFLYGGPLATAIVRFKHGDMPALGRRLASLAIPVAPPPAADVVAAVPLHRKRLAARGFNQSAVIAKVVARAIGARWIPRVILRTRDTPSQGGLSAAARKENVAGAFVARRSLGGASVLLVDDVWTTGATARACARALRRAGAASVSVWTLARVE